MLVEPPKTPPYDHNFHNLDFEPVMNINDTKEKPIFKEEADDDEEIKDELKVEPFIDEISSSPASFPPQQAAPNDPILQLPVVKPEVVPPDDEPLHDNENKPNVLESIPDLENNKNHQQHIHHNLHHHNHQNQITTESSPILVNSNNSVKSKDQSSNITNNKEWNHEERRKVETRNNNMRQIIYKEVKRPGKNYDRLLELLKELHGPADIRQQYIMDVIKEANRFKRNHMAQIIQQNMPNLVSIDS